MNPQRLGVVVGGTFNTGLTVRLDPATDTEALRIGSFCVIDGVQNRYFSLLQDLQLQVTDPRLMAAPPRDLSPFLQRILAGTATYAVAEVKPMLMMPKYGTHEIVDQEEAQGPRVVRTIPMHFAELLEATALDFATVFGEDQGPFFAVGKPLTMEIDVCLDLRRVVERSNGVFGSTGTGKSFLARLLLAGIIHRNMAANLVFDMHDEYAIGKQAEENKEWVKGLRELFPTKVVVYSLDPHKTKSIDAHLIIGLDQIEAADILLLSDELALSPTAETNMLILERALGRNWLSRFLALTPADLEEFCNTHNAHQGSLEALQRKLHRLQQPYVREHGSFHVVDEMLQQFERGKHVILQFGRFGRPLDYMLVANIVTRRIREKYRERAEAWQESRAEGDKPRPLMITIEEAHKFLNPALARQTIFGTIARELRKYFVTLLIVDQRPSGIDPEILSQIGTRISGKLTDEHDLEAVLTGVSDRSAIRAGLASLDTRGQMMIFGHAVPMPVQLRTRRYDHDFYQAMSQSSGVRLNSYHADQRSHDPKVDITDIWGK